MQGFGAGKGCGESGVQQVLECREGGGEERREVAGTYAKPGR